MSTGSESNALGNDETISLAGKKVGNAFLPK